MRFIKLTQGKFAIVDDADFGWLNRFKWHSLKRICTKRVLWYAGRQFRNSSAKNTKGESKQTLILMHRLIIDAPKGREVDHINGNGLDNRRCNLRACSHYENMRNQRKSLVKKTSRYKGVYWDRQSGKWRARTWCNGKHIHICYCNNEQDAAKAYDCKAKELFGEFARFNFPTAAAG